MPVYLAALLTLGFYASAVPVKFALLLRVDGSVNFGAGGAIFENRFALKRARQRASGRKKHLPWHQAELDLRKFRAAAKLARQLLRETRLEQIRLSGRVSLPDAAQTALVVGFIRAAEAALTPVLRPGALRLALEPDFSGGGSEFTAQCMFSISAGQIMRGMLRGAGEFIAEAASRHLSEFRDEFLSKMRLRRVREWISTPLRISCAPRWRTSGTWWTSTR